MKQCISFLNCKLAVSCIKVGVRGLKHSIALENKWKRMVMFWMYMLIKVSTCSVTGLCCVFVGALWPCFQTPVRWVPDHQQFSWRHHSDLGLLERLDQWPVRGTVSFPHLHIHFEIAGTNMHLARLSVERLWPLHTSLYFSVAFF